MSASTPLADPKNRGEGKTADAKSTVARSSRAEDRRKRLQNLRQQDRGSQSGRDSDSESLVASTTRPSRRSLGGRIRSERGAAENSVLSEENEDEDAEDEADAKGKKQEPQQVEEEYEDLVTMNEPQHMFPFNAWIAPHSRDVENGLQPLLYMNPGHPKFNLPIMNCARPMTECFSASNPLIQFHKHELDIITGNAEIFDYSQGQQGAGGGLFDQPLGEQDALLGTEPRDKWPTKGTIEPLMTTFHQRQDGIYANTLPVMATPLMRAEVLDGRYLPMADLVQKDICLSRATQRILRDVKGSLDQDRYRAMWREMMLSNYNNRSGFHGSPKKRPAPKNGRRGDRRRQDDEDDSDTDAAVPDTPLRLPPKPAVPVRSSAAATAELLKQLGVGPILRIMDDPVVDLPSQPVIPDPTAAYGGTLGQWPDHSTATERLGPLVVGGESKKGDMRSVLRVHIHQLGLLEHPSICEEERVYARLKDTYQQYCTLIQQDNLGYVCGRLVGLIDELRRLLSMYNEPNFVLENEEILAIRSHYRDLSETLPALCEMRWAIDALASQLMAGWGGIKTLRRESGCVSTPASLTVRRIVMGDDVPPEEDDSEDDTDTYASPRGRRRRADSESDEEGRRKPRRGRRGTSASASGRSDPQSDFGGGRQWAALKELLPYVKDSLLSDVQEFVARERANELAAAFGAGGGGLDASIRGRTSVTSTPRGGRSPRASVGVRSSQKGRAGSVNGGLFGGEAALLPGMTADDATDEYVQRTIEMAQVCVRDLLRGGRDHGRDEEDEDDRPAAGESLLPEYVIRLAEEGQVTPDAQVSPVEAERRRHVREMRFKLVLHVNGKSITQSETSQVQHPSLIANFNQVGVWVCVCVRVRACVCVCGCRCVWWCVCTCSPNSLTTTHPPSTNPLHPPSFY